MKSWIKWAVLPLVLVMGMAFTPTSAEAQGVGVWVGRSPGYYGSYYRGGWYPGRYNGYYRPYVRPYYYRPYAWGRPYYGYGYWR